MYLLVSARMSLTAWPDPASAEIPGNTGKFSGRDARGALHGGANRSTHRTAVQSGLRRESPKVLDRDDALGRKLARDPRPAYIRETYGKSGAQHPV